MTRSSSPDKPGSIQVRNHAPDGSTVMTFSTALTNGPSTRRLARVIKASGTNGGCLVDGPKTVPLLEQTSDKVHRVGQ